MNRKKRTETAKETLKILEQGYYTNSLQENVQIAESLHFAKTYSVHYTPGIFEEVFDRRDKKLRNRRHPFTLEIEVSNETSLHAAKRLSCEQGRDDVLCLNFASAKHPGGGFMKGAETQEESLARASGLYPSIAQMTSMYATKRNYRSALYTNHMIYSPKVPVFRDDKDELLEAPYPLSIITAPAVNAGAVRRNEKEHIAKIEPVMLARIEKVLSLAVIHDHDTLILGAWGCGVFQNEPAAVARYFKKHLLTTHTFKGAFQKVVFAVLDNTTDHRIITPFQKTFAQV